MAETFRFTLRGEQDVRRRLERLMSQFDDAVPGALREEAEQVMTASKRDHVPVDLGTLRSSGHVTPAVRRGKDVEVELVYGGAAAPYALAVHEHPSEHSPPSWQGKLVGGIDWSPEGRGPKYLEKPLNEAKAGMADRIARRLAKEL